MTNIYITSAFTKNNQGGNKAGVVFFEKLTTQQKKDIAYFVNLSETAFVYKGDKTDYKIEYFTPVEEVDLCGHATIATFATMLELNMIDEGKYTIETKAGILDVIVDHDFIMMQQNNPIYLDYLNSEIFRDCFDLSLLNQNYPIQIVSTGLKDIIVPISSIEDLSKLNINFDQLKEISKVYDVVGMHAYAIEEKIVARNFAPLYGINEESATGTANCALACYLWKQGIKQETYIFEQGYELNELSEIIVHLDFDETINHVQVGGKGKIIDVCKQ